MCTGNTLTLLLSGHVLRPQSADLRPFWRGFIELQKKLPKSKKVTQIATHSWNKEMQSLVEVVYAPQAQKHERQPCFYPDFMMEIEPPNRFEQGIERLNSTWKNVSFQSILGNVRSRMYAIALMDKLPQQSSQVLMTRWDLGQTGSHQVNQLVVDAALPENYLYLAYYSEVDEGYADMWILAPWEDAKCFQNLDKSILQSLKGENDYLDLCLKKGWPRSRVRSFYEDWWTGKWGQYTRKFLREIEKKITKIASGNEFINRVSRRLNRTLSAFLNKPPVTAENSFLEKENSKKIIFPEFLALNIHALLKYFVLSEGLREKVRFLTYQDFSLSTQSGQLIAPKPIVLVLHQGFDQILMDKIFLETPLPLQSVYWLDSGRITRCFIDKELNIKISYYSIPQKDVAKEIQYVCHIEKNMSSKLEMPILILPNAEKYIQCKDWFYLNALIKYIYWSQTEYIKFDSEIDGSPHLEFPDLYVIRSQDNFSLFKAIGTLAGITSFVQAIVKFSRSDQVDSSRCRMSLDFLVVKKTEGLF